MRVKKKFKESFILHCDAGDRLFPVVVGCLLFLYLFSFAHQRNAQSGETHLSTNQRAQFSILEEVEEENIQLPQPRKRSTRAAKQKPKQPTTFIDEFLDESSQIRHVFFPDQRTFVDPRKDYGNDTYYYYLRRIWLDTEGNPIQAHEGGILYDSRTKMYYWYGEYKNGPTYHAHKRGAARFCISSLGSSTELELTPVQFLAEQRRLQSLLFIPIFVVDVIGVNCY
uniref:Uncharacterized protein n=1 Tax=Solanum lycopersicum TaxID=4081 RepID=A0A3Q7G5V5_SOLLC